MISRTPGEGRYAVLEREQRWWISTAPEEATDPASICDRYLDGTRLRLRRVEAGGETVFKLAQKVRPDPRDPSLVKLTNMYLSPAEYEALRRLPAAELTKTRLRWETGGRTLAVDRLHGPLEGLVLVEAELATGEPRRPAPLRDMVEVTDDDRYSGGRLARATGDEIRRLIAGRPVVSPPSG